MVIVQIRRIRRPPNRNYFMGIKTKPNNSLSNTVKQVKDTLVIFHQNIRGHMNKSEELNCLIATRNCLYTDVPYILCPSEHHLDQLELGRVHCRSSMIKGGVCIYVHHDLCHSKIDLSSFSIFIIIFISIQSSTVQDVEKLIYKICSTKH
jgi:hypothetical protein